MWINFYRRHLRNNLLDYVLFIHLVNIICKAVIHQALFYVCGIQQGSKTNIPTILELRILEQGLGESVLGIKPKIQVLLSCVGKCIQKDMH